MNLAPTARAFLCNHTVIGHDIDKSGHRSCQSLVAVVFVRVKIRLMGLNVALSTSKTYAIDGIC
jgi:hypothetical protein